MKKEFGELFLYQNRLVKQYDIGFGISENLIRELNFKSSKKNLFYPEINSKSSEDNLREQFDLFLNKFIDQVSNYWFVTSEDIKNLNSIYFCASVAAGSLYISTDFKKSNYINPQTDVPSFYIPKNKLNNKINSLIVNNQPTKEYKKILHSQREWLYLHGTNHSRIAYILRRLIKDPIYNI
jgi:hypothetical protein